MTAARTAIVSTAVALVALAVLHLLRPDLSVPSSMISEYAVGPYGTLMAVVFGGFSLGSLALCAALWPHARGLVGRAGLVFLLLAAAGLAIGGIFPVDLSTTDPNAMSFSGRMHGVGFAIGVPGQSLALLLLSLALRRQPAWQSAPLLALTALVWISVAVMGPLLAAEQWYGVPNRIFIVAYGVWVILVARPLASLSR